MNLTKNKQFIKHFASFWLTSGSGGGLKIGELNLYKTSTTIQPTTSILYKTSMLQYILQYEKNK